MNAHTPDTGLRARRLDAHVSAASLGRARRRGRLFVSHCAQLLSWAQQLAGGDRAAAEDLIHDAFIRFALRDPDLRTVRNLEGYGIQFQRPDSRERLAIAS